MMIFPDIPGAPPPAPHGFGARVTGQDFASFMIPEAGAGPHETLPPALPGAYGEAADAPPGTEANHAGTDPEPHEAAGDAPSPGATTRDSDAIGPVETALTAIPGEAGRNPPRAAAPQTLESAEAPGPGGVLALSPDRTTAPRLSSDDPAEIAPRDGTGQAAPPRGPVLAEAIVSLPRDHAALPPGQTVVTRAKPATTGDHAPNRAKGAQDGAPTMRPTGDFPLFGGAVSDGPGVRPAHATALAVEGAGTLPSPRDRAQMRARPTPGPDVAQAAPPNPGQIVAPRAGGPLVPGAPPLAEPMPDIAPVATPEPDGALRLSAAGSPLSPVHGASYPNSSTPAPAFPATTQISTASARTASDGRRTTEIALNPEELGRVRLRLAATEGVLTVVVSAERAETLELLRRNIDMLARDLGETGYDGARIVFSQEGGAHRDGDAPPPRGPITAHDEPEAPAPAPAPEPAPSVRITLGERLDIRF